MLGGYFDFLSSTKAVGELSFYCSSSPEAEKGLIIIAFAMLVDEGISDLRSYGYLLAAKEEAVVIPLNILLFV